MRVTNSMWTLVVFSGALMCACGGGGGATPAPSAPAPAAAAATPTITTTAAQNGAVIATLASATSGATIYYTLDGTAPTTSSQVYQAPFLVASNLTVEAMATAPSNSASSMTTKAFALNIPSNTLVWSDEFSNASSSPGQPDPKVWGYDTGNNGFGNNELETYCAWGSNTAPCSTASPSAYTGSDNALHIEAKKTSAGVYTSARMKSQGFSAFNMAALKPGSKFPNRRECGPHSGCWATISQPSIGPRAASST